MGIHKLILTFHILLVGWQHALSLAAGDGRSNESPEDTVFKPGTIPLDDSGNEVAAHEGWILQVEDTFLWYGTSSKHNSSAPSGASDWLSDSVVLYVSHDLATWHKKATVFTAAALPAARMQQMRANADGPYRLERPKVLYNSAHRYYVLIFHLDNIDNSLGEVGYAVSVSPYGPFNFEQASKPDGLGSSHLTVAVADGGDAYLARSVPGTGVSVSKLAGDYLDTTGVCTSIPAAGSTTAAPVPALFSFRSRWYLLVTRSSTKTSRWLSSPTELYVSNGTSLCGATWSKLRRPASGPGSATTFDSQPAFVLSFTFPGSSDVLLIYFGDRWNLSGPGSVSMASYVWLPLVPDTLSELGLQLLDPGQEWRLGDYRPPAPAAA